MTPTQWTPTPAETAASRRFAATGSSATTSGEAGYEACDDGNQVDDDACANDCYPPGQGNISLIATHTVRGADFSATHSNYHPQGICYDHQGGQLAFAQQGTNRIDFLTVGQPGRTGSISTGLRHQTSVACDSDRFLVVDYTGNAGREDMHRISRNGARSVHWNERAGYGGFPVAVFGDELWRTDLSRRYDWSNLGRIHRTQRTTQRRSPQALTASTAASVTCVMTAPSCGCSAMCTTAPRARSCGRSTPTTAPCCRPTRTPVNALGGEPKVWRATGRRRLYVYCYNEARNQDGALLEYRHP